MKRTNLHLLWTISFLLLSFQWNILFCQFIVPNNRLGNWVPAGYSPTQRTIPRYFVNNFDMNTMFGAVGNGVTDNTQALNNALQYCKSNNLPSAALLFSAGNYRFNSQILLDGSNNLKRTDGTKINIALHGQGSKLTTFSFDSYNITGSMILVKDANGVGIENIKMIRVSNSNPVGMSQYYVEFSNSTSCWVYGVEGVKAVTHHVDISGGNNIVVKGCYFHEADNYGVGGRGYGVNMGGNTFQCLIEDNIFRYLRHGIVFQYGAHDNVAGYNYVREGHAHDDTWGDYIETEIVCHGSGNNNNLIEGNVVELLGSDNMNGSGGNNNTFFRNRVDQYYLTGNLGVTNEFDSPNVNVIGDHLEENGQHFAPSYGGDAQSTALEIYAEIGSLGGVPYPEYFYLLSSYHEEDFYLADISYYYPNDVNSCPNFLNISGVSWPAIGPHLVGRRDIPLLSQTNAAEKRWIGGNILTVAAGSLIYNIILTAEQSLEGGGTISGLYKVDGLVVGTTFNGHGSIIEATYPGNAFMYWSDGSTENPRTLINNVSVYAGYKIVHKSNTATTFSNNSQRKFIRTQNGWYHMVYESMGHVWYEYSSDGANWTLAGGQPLDNGNGKLPSIDYIGTSVVIVFQQKTGNYYTVQLQQWIFQNGNYILNEPYPIWTEPVDLYSANANPNVAWANNHSFVVTWERKNNYYDLKPGINYKYGAFDENGVLGCQNTGRISTTDANSINATIYSNKSSMSSPPFFDIAWEQVVSSTSSSIEYCTLSEWYYEPPPTPPCFGIVQDPQSPLTISIPGIYRNYHPSIVQFPDGNVRINYIDDHSGVGDAYSVHSVLCDPWASPMQYWEYALNVKSTSINMIDNSNNFYFVWSQYWANVWNDKFVNGSNLSQIKTLNTSGQDVQLCNGSASTNMFVIAYRPVTLPYNFQISNSLGSFGKVNSISISSGRGVAIGKDGAGFYYSLGDITVDGNTLNWVAYDSLNNLHNNNVVERKAQRYNNNINDVNKMLMSDPFELKDNSEIIFNEQSGVGDSLAAAKVLGENGYVSFKIELVDDASGEVIGTVKELKLSSTNLPAYKLLSYSLKTKGIRGTMEKVRITMATTIDKPEFALVDQYADIDVVGKISTPRDLTLEGINVIVDYALNQNFPNPFNPTTTINYQLSAVSQVTLRVYDILGREVATLVNEMKKAGYYTATFDARNLASGIYFARFTVTNELKKSIYTKSIKLLLMK